MFKAAKFVLLLTPIAASGEGVPAIVRQAWPPKDSPYTVEYVGSVSSPADLAIRRSFFARVGDFVLGEPQRSRGFLRPFTLGCDGDRLLVADQDAHAVHLFESARNRHRVLTGPRRAPMQSPIGIDTDDSGRIYVADSVLGKIFLFDKEGAFKRLLGDVRGEGLFKRPTGLAVDRNAHVIYLTDTLRHKVFVLDFEGRILRDFGRRGEGPGEFNFPTGVAVANGRVFVLDALNFRVQVFNTDGSYIRQFGRPVNAPGGLLRPKSLAVDARRGLVFVVDALFEVVQAFSLDGELVFAFGQGGLRPGEFQLAASVCLRPDGRFLVADAMNRRIQIFQLVPGGKRGDAE